MRKGGYRGGVRKGIVERGGTWGVRRGVVDRRCVDSGCC